MTDREGYGVGTTSSRASSSQAAPSGSEYQPNTTGQNVPAAVVDAAQQHREEDDNPAVWLDQDYEDEENVRAYDEGLAEDDDHS